MQFNPIMVEKGGKMKAVKILAGLVLSLLIASPAMATLKISDNFSVSGYLRTQFIDQTIKDKSVNPADETLIDQRFRLKSTYTLSENLTMVYYAEVDTVWGEKSKGGIGGGGKTGTDGINVESKNIYADLKVPDSNARLRVGLQGIADEFFEGLVNDEDMAGVHFTTDISGLKLILDYAKLSEGDDRKQWDDTDYYGVMLQKKLNDTVSLGLGAYHLDINDPGDEMSFTWYGVRSDVMLGKVGLEGMLIVQDGELETAGEDTSAWMASIKGKFAPAENLKATLRLTYFSPDDDANDDGAWYGGHDDLGLGGSELNKEGLMIMLKDYWICNAGTTAYAMADGARDGYGLIALTSTAKFSELPYGLYVNLAAGYFMAADDTKNDDPATKRQGSNIGYEVAAGVGKEIVQNYDLSLRGAYAGFGDFYDGTVTGNNGSPADPDNVYKITMMLHVKF